ncbi:MAG: type II secretion system F family protein [Acidimicrobiia bacterium]|nr:type II secretion system F family protein [Acidimicrobiia bacterium]
MTRLLLVVLVGGGLGYAVFLALRALQPRAVPLPVALEELGRRRWSVAELTAAGGANQTTQSDLAGRARRFGVGLMEATGLVDMGLLERKLRVLGRPLEVHAAHKVRGALFGLMLGVAGGIVLPLGGVTVSPAMVLMVAVGLGIIGWVYPDLPLNDEVEERRASFRHALSAYLDLVTSLLAGGAGLETALHAAAESGGGWAFAEIRQVLVRARLTGRTVWELFDELGTQLGIEEMREMAAAAELAGDQGAQIRNSLGIKADTLRKEQLAAIRAKAESASSKMQLPSVLFVVGLVIFLLYGILSIDTTLAPSEITVITGL